ncbi:MAG TPA: acyl-CoA carboxylase subunit epsilon [Jatrophihabitantaceae bacterium]|nr:acyl-CoA carboxylase subunit epsilon [Jatrophihabitantaceae bacterium]
MNANEPRQAQLRVVKGDPTAEELAVVTAVVTAAASAGPADAPAAPVRGRWNDPARMHRRALLTGPGGWRAALR